MFAVRFGADKPLSGWGSESCTDDCYKNVNSVYVESQQNRSSGSSLGLRNILHGVVKRTFPHFHCLCQNLRIQSVPDAVLNSHSSCRAYFKYTGAL
jgi:hypothetical protein